MSVAFCCEGCGDTAPRWRITRVGDAVITWACDPDLAGVCDGLQRDGEITELTVTNARKGREWAEISRSLRQIAAEGS